MGPSSSDVTFADIVICIQYRVIYSKIVPPCLLAKLRGLVACQHGLASYLCMVWELSAIQVPFRKPT